MRNSNRTGNSYGSQTRLQFTPLSAKPELSQFLQKLEISRYHAYIRNWVRSESDYKWLALGFGVFGFDGRKGTEGGGRTWWCSPPGDDPAKGGGALPVVAASREREREVNEREKARGEHPTSHSLVLMGSQCAWVVTKQRQPSDRYSTARINAGACPLATF